MRVSNLQLHNASIANMQRHQAELEHTEEQLASGLRIMKPSDDPSGAVKVLNLNTNMDIVNQFSRNIAVAEASLSLEETVVANVSNTLQRIRELTVQGNNATNDDVAKNSIAEEIYQRLDELVSLGNTRDASGEYIFSGYKVSAPPFIDNGTSVNYQGDQGQRMVQIGNGSQVAIRDSGSRVFQEVASGDGNIQVLANSNNTGNLVLGQFGLTGSFTPDTYTVTFTQDSSTSPMVYTVTDSSNNTTATGNYKSGTNISFAGAQFAVTGTPADGDVVTLSPSENHDLFATVRNIADALARPAPSSADVARFHNDMAEGLTNLDQALTNVNNIRAGIGARMNNIETLNEINQDFKVQIETVLSDTQDLDYVEAISRFNLQLTALQAAQQAFIKTSSLSLFQYL